MGTGSLGLQYREEVWVIKAAVVAKDQLLCVW
jgi:hypothetical protein